MIFLNDFAGDGETANNMKIAIANLSATSESVKKMATNMETVVADPQTAQSLKNIISNADNISQRADNMMSKVSSIEVKPDDCFIFYLYLKIECLKHACFVPLCFFGLPYLFGFSARPLAFPLKSEPDRFPCRL